MKKKTVFRVLIYVFLIFSACSGRKTGQEYVKEPDEISEQQSDLYSNQQYNAEEDFEIEIMTYANGDKSLKIINYIGESKNVRIPPYIQGLPVVIIGKNAFKDKGITSVIIPDTVTDIWEFAFAENELTSVIIPDGITHIPESVFEKNKLTIAIIPDSVISIGKSAFLSNQLTSIIISANIKLDASAFDDFGFYIFYKNNGNKAGVYTRSFDKWNVAFLEEIPIEPIINGTYEIFTAYSHLYDQYATHEIETEKRGTKIIIDGNKAIFGNDEYQLNEYEYPAEYIGKYGKYGIMDYEFFLSRPGGLNYNNIDRKIIGENYKGRLKVMTMKNDKNKHNIFFADNKLIIEISIYDRGKETETEFNHLIISRHDHFFYIAERIME
jgi:hypothetical protein